MTYSILAWTNTFIECSEVFIKFSDTVRYSVSTFHLIAISSYNWGRGTTIALYNVNAVCSDAKGIPIVIRRPLANVITSDSKRDSYYARSSCFGMAYVSRLSDFFCGWSPVLKNCSKYSFGSRDIGAIFESRERSAFNMFNKNARRVAR